jgi:hypothetical protein
MKVPILTVCDFASLYGNKVCIMGAVDILPFNNFPAVIQSLVIFAKVQFELSDEGEHMLSTAIIDADGGPIATPLASKKEIRFGAQKTIQERFQAEYSFNHCQNLRIPKPGLYTVEFRVDGAAIASAEIVAVQISPRR